MSATIRFSAPISATPGPHRGKSPSSPKSAVARIARGILNRGLTHAVNENQPSVAPINQIGAVNEEVAAGQPWVRITPYGVFPNPVGLQVVDREAADAMVSAFNSISGRVMRLGKGLPVFIGHPDHPAWAKLNPTVRCEALGRVKELEARDDGLYGRTAFNESGLPLVTGDGAAYDSWSPNWGMVEIQYKGRKAYRPVVLRSLGLTNTPNIPGNVIGLNEPLPSELTSDMKDQILKLLAVLGITLTADATDEQITSALSEAVPAVTKIKGEAAEATVQKEAAAKSAGDATAAVNEATALKAELQATRAARASDAVMVAINEGKLTAADATKWKDRLTNTTNYAADIAELSALKPAINTMPLAAAVGGRRAESAISGDRTKAIVDAINEYKAANPHVDHNTAFAAVKASKPTLFAIG